MDRLAGVAELTVRREEGVLDDVLRLLRGADHVAAERQHGAMVAVEQRLEGGLGPRADHRDEAVVRQHPQHADRHPGRRREHRGSEGGPRAGRCGRVGLQGRRHASAAHLPDRGGEGAVQRTIPASRGPDHAFER
jgi:hypothetical protein